MLILYETRLVFDKKCYIGYDSNLMGKEKVSLLKTNEAAKILFVHSNTLRRWSDTGLVKTYRVGPRADRRFREEDIVRFMSNDSHYHHDS